MSESEANGRSERAYYLLGVDVGRLNCTTEVIVMKVAPSPHGVPTKQIVNLYSFDEEHFRAQAIKIKRIFKEFRCKMAVIDGNGLGIGLVDELVLDHDDPDTGELLPNFGVYNDDDGKYKKFENENTIKAAMYIMKANTTINSELYAYTQAQMRSGKLRFLIDEDRAKTKLQGQTQYKRMGAEKRAEYLRPYVMTSILRDQMIIRLVHFVCKNKCESFLIAGNSYFKKIGQSAAKESIYFSKKTKETKT